MDSIKIKKEISLDSQTLTILKVQADRAGIKLINYMEQILREKANEYELTEEYKELMDNMLDKHNKGKVAYTSWEDFKAEVFI